MTLQLLVFCIKETYLEYLKCCLMMQDYTNYCFNQNVLHFLEFFFFHKYSRSLSVLAILTILFDKCLTKNFEEMNAMIKIKIL